MSVKVFQIGFNKAATSTLFRFFEKNGIRAIHWENGEIAERFEANRAAGRDPFADYPDVYFFSDMSTISGARIVDVYKDFEYIYKFHPDALYILNTRKLDDWVQSRLHHPRLAERYQKFLGVQSTEEVVAYWRKEWDEHHAKVRAFFADKPGQLLEFDIDRHGPAELAEFVKDHYTLDPALYESRNVTAVRLEQVAKRKEQRQRVRQAGGGKGKRQGGGRQPTAKNAGGGQGKSGERKRAGGQEAQRQQNGQRLQGGQPRGGQAGRRAQTGAAALGEQPAKPSFYATIVSRLKRLVRGRSPGA